MSLGAWYQSLFDRAYPPAAKFVSGAAAGAGVPRSLQEAKGMVGGFGEMLSGPTPQQMAEGPKPLIEATQAAPAAVSENPWGSAGFALGMFAGGIGPDDVPKLSKIPRKMNPNERVLRERARVHRELEGKKTPMRIGDTWIFPEGGAEGAIPIASHGESTGDLIAAFGRMPDQHLQNVYRTHRQDMRQKTVPQDLQSTSGAYMKGIEKELSRRGLRGDISAERRMASRVKAERARIHASLEGHTTGEQIARVSRQMQYELRKLGYNPNRGGYTNDFLPDKQLTELGIDLGAASRYRELRDKHMSKLLIEPGMPGTLSIQEGAESLGDYASLVKSYQTSDISTDFLVKHSYELEKATGPSASTIAMRDAARARGWRGDLSDQLHVLHEGPPIVGGASASRLGELPNVQSGEPPVGPIWTREERGSKLIRQAGIDPEQPDLGRTYGWGLPGRALSMAETPDLQKLPTGRTAMYMGDRWLKTTRGWTRVGGAPGKQDFNWILSRHFDVRMEQPPELREILDDIVESRPQTAVNEIKEHGGWGSLPTDVEARKIVARHVRQRVQLGKATTNEVVWLNLNDMRKPR